MERINKICKEFNEVLNELNICFFNEEKFDNPFHSDCILRITDDKIAFGNINRLCEYKTFNDVSK